MEMQAATAPATAPARPLLRYRIAAVRGKTVVPACCNNVGYVPEKLAHDQKFPRNPKSFIAEFAKGVPPSVAIDTLHNPM